jgi:hypothetical protein
MLLLVIEGIYELCRSDVLICHDMHAKFHTDWLVVQITERVTLTDTQTETYLSLF